MQKKVVFLGFLLIHFLSAFAIEVEVSVFKFQANSPYAEVYFRVNGQSVKWNQNALAKEAAVEILYFVKGKDDKIHAYDKFVLTRTVVDSIADFIAVKRIGLPAGEYTLRMEAFDKNNPEDKLELEKIIRTEPLPDGPSLSDIMLLATFEKSEEQGDMVKGGYLMEPLAYSFVPPSMTAINIYSEAYRPARDTATEFFLKVSLYEGFGLAPEKSPVFSKVRKLSGALTEPVFMSLPATSVKSGDFHLTVSIIDKQKNVIAERKTDLIRSNPQGDIAWLEQYNDSQENSFVQNLKAADMDFILKAHLPITPQNQVSTLGELIRSDRLASQRQFIFRFWKTRYNENPEAAFNKYMEVAKAVNKQFQTNAGYGFQSDRGHIFLKYGKPTNVLTIDTELDAPPYEIWYYFQMPGTNQTNVRFLFYNPSLVHNDFKLLHSTCLGERSYPAWETELYKSVPLERLGNTVDATQVGDNRNRNARKYFNEF